MVREVRLSGNDPDEQHAFRNLPLEDDSEDRDESPLEPPPKRRCSKRNRPSDPTRTPSTLPSPPDDR